MPTPGERRALLFFASVAALGVAVRGWRAFHAGAPEPGVAGGDRAALARQIEVVDSAVAAGGVARKARPARPAASPAASAARGAGTDARSRAQPAPRANDQPRQPLAARVTKGRARQPAPIDTQPRDPRQSYWDRSLFFDSVRAAMVREDERAAVRRPSSHAPSSPRRMPSAGESPPVDLDVATFDEAAAVPLIGPALARRIVSNRIESGPFGSLAGLERVQGISAALARRLAPFVTFSRAPRPESAAGKPARSKSARQPDG